jgi:hypothetical protein
MKKNEVKENISVIDRWYPEKGTGKITKVLKTIFKVSFKRETITYDYPHAQFLDVVNK